MKSHFNRTWLIISLIIIANILIFVFLSTKLESFVIDNIVTEQEKLLGI